MKGTSSRRGGFFLKKKECGFSSPFQGPSRIFIFYFLFLFRFFIYLFFLYGGGKSDGGLENKFGHF